MWGGLVGYCDGTITDSHAKGGSVSGRWAIGGLVGRTNGMVAGSCASADVSGVWHAGGLVGDSDSDSVVANCYAEGNTLGQQYVGGIVGFNYTAPIRSCYATGKSHGDNNVGGLVGRNFRGEISACFWDKDASSLMNMCGGQGDEATGCDDSYGKSTAEMQTASTFLDAGWDFVDEIENGTEDIWWILEGQTYPRLWWELRRE